MSKETTLVERARDKAADLRALNKRDAPTPVMRLLEDVADRIEALEAENKRINKLFGLTKDAMQGYKRMCELQATGGLEAENERLRALTEWRPIESAPRGRVLYVCGRQGNGKPWWSVSFLDNKGRWDDLRSTPLGWLDPAAFPAPPTEEG